METPVGYQTDSKPEEFFGTEQCSLFHEFLELYKDRIEGIKYIPFGPEKGLKIKINCLYGNRR